MGSEGNRFLDGPSCTFHTSKEICSNQRPSNSTPHSMSNKVDWTGGRPTDMGGSAAAVAAEVDEPDAANGEAGDLVESCRGPHSYETSH